MVVVDDDDDDAFGVPCTGVGQVHGYVLRVCSRLQGKFSNLILTSVWGGLQERCLGAQPLWWQGLQMQLCLLLMGGSILKPS